MLQFVFRGTTPNISILEPPILFPEQQASDISESELGNEQFHIDSRTVDPTPTLCLGLSPISLNNPIGKQYLSGKQQAGYMWITGSVVNCQPVKGYPLGIPCQRAYF